jgi:hypothetical protein|tara:strand:- start:241 stop:414 length:174 start_codon:yes stop_codon:yes gene_type:complete
MDIKTAARTPINIVVVHATQRARGAAIRTRPKMVRRMLGTVHMATVLLALLIQAMIK